MPALQQGRLGRCREAPKEGRQAHEAHQHLPAGCSSVGRVHTTFHMELQTLTCHVRERWWRQIRTAAWTGALPAKLAAYAP